MADPAMVGGGLGAAITAALLAVVRHFEIKTRFNGGGRDTICDKLERLITLQEEAEKTRVQRDALTLAALSTVATGIAGIPERIALLMKSVGR